MKWMISLCLLLSLTVQADESKSLSDYLDENRVLPGFFDVVIDDDAGTVMLLVPNDRGEFLFQPWLARGVGSNDIGLDRGKPGSTRLVVFERVGGKALLRQKNTDYRAVSDNAAERLAVEEAFADSVLWGFKVIASDETRYLIDYTDFLISDFYQVAETLKRMDEGDFKADTSRSAPYLPNTRSFPRNTELEGIVTLVGRKAGRELRSVSPDNSAVTVHQHHSLIALPEPGYEMRAFHPESGYFPFTYVDHASPVGSDLRQRYIPRHRLAPGGTITYYLDPGVPEPVRSALIEGGEWWNDAFKAAGFENGFEIRILPEGADPLDVRYNIIQWVHRSTRGWSYGMSVRDPRTGEILKGKVTLGSLRIRQDLMIAQGLLSPFTEGTDEAAAAARLEDMALARIRQLSAHEIGHTLGLAHNYVSSLDNRASVMDYPHPLLRLDRGKVDLSDAYDSGIGEWDSHAIRYGYAEADDEAAFIRSHIAKGRAEGLEFITDRDARAWGGAHPDAHLWDSGDDVLEELANTLAVRQVALANFGEDTIREGTPYSELADILVPIYYLHRYQAESAVKLVGGVEYDYAIKGERAFGGIAPVEARRQEEAIEALIGLLQPETLETPESVLAMIPPKAFGYSLDRENAPSLTKPLFDPVTAAEAAAEETLRFLFVPSRLARLEQQHARDRKQPGLEALLEDLVDATVKRRAKGGLTGLVQQRVNLLVVEHLLIAATSPNSASGVAAQSRAQLAAIAERFEEDKDPNRQMLRQMINRSLSSGQFERRKTVAKLPPGSPI